MGTNRKLVVAASLGRGRREYYDPVRGTGFCIFTPRQSALEPQQGAMQWVRGVEHFDKNMITNPSLRTIR